MTSARVVVLVLVVAACGSRSAELAAKQPPSVPRVVTDDTSPVGRLDERAFPTGYELALAVDPAAAGYSGEVAITVSVTRPLRVIWLHGRDLVIDRATVTTADGGIQTARVVADERVAHTEGQGELIGIGVDQPVSGRVLVHLAYHASYREKDGMIRAATQGKLVFTDLEPNDARSLMPCFDDPRFKVPWTVTVTAPDGMGVYANYPEQRRTKVDGGRVRVAFQPTRPLPSYLIAVAVGELEVVPVASGAVPIQLLVPAKDVAAHTAVIRDAIPPLLAELVRVFDDEVPFPKLDMLVIPMDPGRGGMENPGLTTLGAHMVLVDPAVTGHHARRKVEDAVHVVAHELAHLWIGDLITIGNWGDLWLQEGGATWFGIRAARTYLGAKWIPPFNRDVIDARLKEGARAPIRMSIGALADANAMFRTETYAGGAAVFDALETWLGEDVITRAFADLIDRHAAQTVTTQDFLAAVRGRAPANVKPADLADSVAAMLDATRMPAVSASCKPGAIELTVDTPAAVPVCLARDGAPRACTVVRGGRATIEAATCPRWMALNPGGGAPYTRAWAPGTLSPVLEQAPLTGRDDAAMLSELRTLLIMGKFSALSLADQITAAAWLASTEDAAPMVSWRAVELLETIERAAPDDKARKAMLARVQTVAAKRAPRFLVEPSKESVTAPLAGWLARRGDKAARAAAAATIVDLVKGASASDAKNEAVSSRAAGSDVKQFRALRTLALAQDRRSLTILRALASFQFPRIADELRVLVKNPKLTPRDLEVVLVEALRNPVLRPHLASFLAARADLTMHARAQIGRSMCNEAEATALADSIKGDFSEGERTRMLEQVAKCVSTQKAWDVN